ncbi:hypothetical protein B0H11DRAFT_978574 [Mycena galericulata]|nr:hypothetical protein B0H11DRAFT_978574 [Mycena galericulata]
MSSTASASTNRMSALSLSLAWIPLASSPPHTRSPLYTEDGDSHGSDGDRQEARTYSSRAYAKPPPSSAAHSASMRPARPIHE